MLCDLIGDDKHQIGNASVHLLYGYRDVHRTLKTGSIAVRADPGDVSFNAFHVKYNECTMTPWSHYCQEHVRHNKNLETQTTTIATPVFPALDEGMTTQDLRVVLYDYIEAQWSHARGLEEKTQMPWSDITGLLSSYLAVDISSDLQMLDNPAHMSIGALFGAIGFIKSYQSRNGPFSIFRMRSPPPFPAANTLTPDLELPEDTQILPMIPTTPTTTMPPFPPTSPIASNAAPTVITHTTTDLAHGGTPGVPSLITPSRDAATPFVQPAPLPINVVNTSPTNSPYSHTNITMCDRQTIPESSLPSSPLSSLSSTPPPLRSTATEVRNVEAQPSDAQLSKKRKRDTLVKPSAKRIKVPVLPHTNPRRSGRKKAPDPEPKDAIEQTNNPLPENNVGMSRSGKPLKNNKNWVYVPRV